MSHVAIVCLSAILVFSGCLELVRRHPESADDDPGNGNPSQGQNVQKTETHTKVGKQSDTVSEMDSTRIEALVTVSVAEDVDSTASADARSATITKEVALPVQDKQPNALPVKEAGVAGEDTTYRRNIAEAKREKSASVPDPKALVEYQKPVEEYKVEKPDSSLTSTPALAIRRPRGLGGSVKQINEYVFWCIENRLWKEARVHLEHAIEQDSASASLQNNIGIVYEHFGEEELALASYQRANVLNPKQKRYRANIDRMEHRWRAVEDTLGRIEIFNMDQVGGADSIKVETPAGVEPTADEDDSGGTRP